MSYLKSPALKDLSKLSYVPTDSGSEFQDDFVLDYDAQGVPVLKKVGVINLQAKIQADLESTDLRLVVSSIISSGVDLASIPVSFDPDVVDVVETQRATPHEIAQALMNFEKNKTLIEEYLAEKKKKEDSSSEHTDDNGGDGND